MLLWAGSVKTQVMALARIGRTWPALGLSEPEIWLQGTVSKVETLSFCPMERPTARRDTGSSSVLLGTAPSSLMAFPSTARDWQQGCGAGRGGLAG